MPSKANYHKQKLHAPKDVEEKLGLVEGDKPEIRIVDEKSFTVSLRCKSSPEDRMIERIDQRPFISKMKAKTLKREDYYDTDRS